MMPADLSSAAVLPVRYRPGVSGGAARTVHLVPVTGETEALMISAMLAEEVATILAARHRPAPVLAHPYAPEHRVFLAGERYGIELPWPAQVHLITGTVPLPPTPTPRGPISWQHLPDDHALSLCREFDVFAATHTALGRPQRRVDPSEYNGHHQSDQHADSERST